MRHRSDRHRQGIRATSPTHAIRLQHTVRGVSRAGGFACVNMSAKVEAWAAIKKLDLTERHGRFMTVGEAQNNVGSPQPSTGS